MKYKVNKVGWINKYKLNKMIHKKILSSKTQLNLIII